MQGISAEQTILPDFTLSEFSSVDNSLSIDMSEQMWKYKNLKEFKGCPVQSQAQDLPVESIDKLERALQLKTKVYTWTGYISPLDEDIQNVHQYNRIQQGLNEGKFSILDQQKHFCGSLNKILVLIVYNQLSYTLHPRYKYLKEQLHVDTEYNN